MYRYFLTGKSFVPFNSNDCQRQRRHEDAQQLHVLGDRAEPMGEEPSPIDEIGVGEGNAENAHRDVGHGQIDEIFAHIRRRPAAINLDDNDDDIAAEGENCRQSVECNQRILTNQRADHFQGLNDETWCHNVNDFTFVRVENG